MCPQLNALENGYMIFTDANFVGSTVQFVCLPESILEGANSASCIESDPQPTWTSTQPKCFLFSSLNTTLFDQSSTTQTVPSVNPTSTDISTQTSSISTTTESTTVQTTRQQSSLTEPSKGISVWVFIGGGVGGGLLIIFLAVCTYFGVIYGRRWWQEKKIRDRIRQRQRYGEGAIENTDLWKMTFWLEGELVGKVNYYLFTTQIYS